MMNALAATLLLVAQPGGQPATPDRPNAVEEITDCRRITDPAQRLACFDRAAGALEQQTEQREIIVLDREQIEESRRESFGLRSSTPPAIANIPVREEIDQVESTITSLRPAGYAKWTFALANGSRWETIQADPTFEPRTGDSIRIERAAFGSFRASVRGGRLLRVRRIG